MQEKYIKSNIDLSVALLCYGVFCVLCHACAVLFFFFVNPEAMPYPLLCRYCIGMLEYSAMSATVVVGGSALVRRVYQGSRP